MVADGSGTKTVADTKATSVHVGEGAGYATGL